MRTSSGLVKLTCFSDEREMDRWMRTSSGLVKLTCFSDEREMDPQLRRCWEWKANVIDV